MRVRAWLASLVLIGVAGSTVPATAQSERAHGLPTIGLPLPPIGLPLPTIGLPLPPIGLSGNGPVPPSQAAVPRRPPGRAPRGLPHSGVPIYSAFYPVFYPVFYPIFYPVGAGPDSASVVPGSAAPGQPTAPTSEPTFEVTLGSLRLEVEPTAGQQIFVDGAYVGTPDDLDGDLALEAGVHVIEVQAPGFDNARIPVRIVAGRLTTYRGTLQSTVRVDTARSGDRAQPDASRTPQPSASTPDVAAPATIGYYIPGCYLGNVPPEDVKLPEGCDPQHAAIVRSPR